MSVKQLVTAEELWEMPEVPGKRFELVDGEVIEVSPAGDLHMAIVEIVYKRLDRFVEQHNLGLVRFDGLGYVIRRAPDQVRVPDVSFVTWEQVPDGEPTEFFWEGAPSLAVEVVSQDDLAIDLKDRVDDYLEAGTQQVWVLWPRTRRVSVFSPNANTREFGPDATLDGGSLLPGFGVRVGDLFEVPHRRQP
ncbi:MAG: Uma2 family endonuclease [Chloroflexota bacterium]|jgi:Uma2 family endonuclease|nr:Uma2 family endonuclease [Chloroflexota bacterium]